MGVGTGAAAAGALGVAWPPSKGSAARGFGRKPALDDEDEEDEGSTASEEELNGAGVELDDAGVELDEP